MWAQVTFFRLVLIQSPLFYRQKYPNTIEKPAVQDSEKQMEIVAGKVENIQLQHKRALENLNKQVMGQYLTLQLN